MRNTFFWSSCDCNDEIFIYLICTVSVDCSPTKLPLYYQLATFPWVKNISDIIILWFFLSNRLYLELFLRKFIWYPKYKEIKSFSNKRYLSHHRLFDVEYGLWLANKMMKSERYIIINSNHVIWTYLRNIHWIYVLRIELWYYS